MSYPTTDRRNGALQSLLKICMWELMQIEDFQPYVQGNTSRLMTTFGLSKQDSNQFAKSIDTFMRAAFLSLFMFQTENLLRMIRNHLPNTSNSDKYYDICKDVLQITHPTNWNQKHDVLQVPALIRNCLHNSGIHTRQNATFVIGTETFDFIQNQMFNKAAWNYIALIINELVTTLEEILMANDVQRLSIT